MADEDEQLWMQVRERIVLDVWLRAWLQHCCTKTGS